MPGTPYRSTPEFDEHSLPQALRKRHSTKAGVWGVINVIEGALRLTYLEPDSDIVLKAGDSGMVLPEQPHFVTPMGRVRMVVDFYDAPPPGDRCTNMP